MVHKTKGVALRTVKYGETSLVVAVFTEMFGIQSYLVNGVRTSSKKGMGRANMFQPGSILELVVYHNELKNLQRIKEFHWEYIYQDVFSDVVKNTIVLFMAELLLKCLRQPEQNQDLYDFIEDAFIELDKSRNSVTANFPLYFTLHLSGFFGFKMNDDYSVKKTILDLQEGNFVYEKPFHPHFIESEMARITSEILKTMQPKELYTLKLNHESRKELLLAYITYYSLHLHEFGTLKSLPVLREVLG